MTVSISVDAMGGDFGPKITVPASLNFLKTHPDASITLVGNKSIINKFLKNCFGFELELKKPGRTKIKTAIKKIAGIIRSKFID